jgi:hypothetical protein
MLIAQHDLSPRVGGGRLPVAVIEDMVADAIAAREIEPIDVAAGAAVIMGWSCSRRCSGSMAASRGRCRRALRRSRAAIAAVRALG